MTALIISHMISHSKIIYQKLYVDKLFAAKLVWSVHESKWWP